MKVDLDAKSRAAIAGWDAAANAESEAEAAEARGLQAGIKRGRADAEKKARKHHQLLCLSTLNSCSMAARKCGLLLRGVMQSFSQSSFAWASKWIPRAFVT